MAYQILNPGVEIWIAPDGEGTVGFATCFGHRVVAGAPICAAERLLEVMTRFEADARRDGKRVCYFGAQERLAEILAQRGPVSRLLVGAQPCWHPLQWVVRASNKPSLRAQIHRAINKKVRVNRWSWMQATAHPQLQRCLAEWLAGRGLPPMHFLVEPDTLGRLEDRRVFVAQRHSEVIGFLVATPVPLRNGWLIEQIIRGRAAPNGTAELMMDGAMRQLVSEGAEYVTLGLSPLSRRAGFVSAPAHWSVQLLLGWVRAHCRRFYNFEGLDAFKAKFLPQTWEPIYLLCSEKKVRLPALAAVAGVFAGGKLFRFLFKALGRAAMQEVRWLMKRR